MGAIIAFEIYRRNDIQIQSGFFDGGPFFTFSNPMKWLMGGVFGVIASMANKNPKMLTDVINKKVSYLITDGSAAMMLSVAGHMNKESIRNLVTACYSFPCMNLSEQLQSKVTFFYGDSEPAKKSMPRLQKMYPNATFIEKKGFNHLQFQAQHEKE
jgi:hypothetical protein